MPFSIYVTSCVLNSFNRIVSVCFLRSGLFFLFFSWPVFFSGEKSIQILSILCCVLQHFPAWFSTKVLLTFDHVGSNNFHATISIFLNPFVSQMLLQSGHMKLLYVLGSQGQHQKGTKHNPSWPCQETGNHHYPHPTVHGSSRNTRRFSRNPGPQSLSNASRTTVSRFDGPGRTKNNTRNVSPPRSC